MRDSQVIVSVVKGRPGAHNFSYATVLQEWSKATDVRLRLIRTKTLLGHLMAVSEQDPTVTRRVKFCFVCLAWMNLQACFTFCFAKFDIQLSTMRTILFCVAICNCPNNQLYRFIFIKCKVLACRQAKPIATLTKTFFGSVVSLILTCFLFENMIFHVQKTTNYFYYSVLLQYQGHQHRWAMRLQRTCWYMCPWSQWPI